MNPEANPVTKALSHEVWELPPDLSLLVDYLEKLPFCWVQAINGEMSYTWLSRSPMVLSERTGLSFPELGLTLSNDQVESVLVCRHPVHAGMIRLSITPFCRSEQLIVDAPASAGDAIAELSRRVVQTCSREDVPGGIERTQRKLCACCSERRRKVQLQGEKHPLYHLLSFACFRDLGLHVDVEGNMFRFGTSLCPLKFEQQEGRMLMGASRSIFYLDISEVFRVVARMDVIDRESFTIIDCYHSFGDRLLSVSQEEDGLFELWCSMAKRAGMEG